MYDDFPPRFEIGKYIATSPHINDEILALCKDLSLEDKTWLARTIARARQTYKNQNAFIQNLTQKELDDIVRIRKDFFQNIFKLSENLYFYDGYFLPTSNFEISVFWYKHGLPKLESSTLAKIRHKDIIDVGGYIGDSAIMFEREFCDKHIYCFEPTSKNFATMQEVLRLNNSKRIIPLKLGLGAREQTLEMSILGSASSAVYDYHTESETTQITTLDSFVEAHNIEVGFIKVDIEGFEMEFLKGAKRTICEQKPAMLLSIYHQSRDFFAIKPLVESWNLGYKFKLFKGEDISLLVDTTLLCEI